MEKIIYILKTTIGMLLIWFSLPYITLGFCILPHDMQDKVSKLFD